MWLEIKDPDQAVDLLGGNAKVARAFAKVAPKTVSIWRSRGFPAGAWPVLAPKLKRLGSFSAAKLFVGILEPRRADDGAGKQD